MLDPSQPTIGWYDQAQASVQGVSTYGDVMKAGGVSLHHAMNRSKAQSVRRNYYATTSYSDAQLLRVLNVLDELQLTNHTLVCAFGDHGQALGEHNLWVSKRARE